jgi:hypothetical protein
MQQFALKQQIQQHHLLQRQMLRKGHTHTPFCRPVVDMLSIAADCGPGPRHMGLHSVQLRVSVSLAPAPQLTTPHAHPWLQMHLSTSTCPIGQVPPHPATSCCPWALMGHVPSLRPLLRKAWLPLHTALLGSSSIHHSTHTSHTCPQAGCTHRQTHHHNQHQPCLFASRRPRVSNRRVDCNTPYDMRTWVHLQDPAASWLLACCAGLQHSCSPLPTGISRGLHVMGHTGCAHPACCTGQPEHHNKATAAAQPACPSMCAVTVHSADRRCAGCPPPVATSPSAPAWRAMQQPSAR